MRWTAGVWTHLGTQGVRTYASKLPSPRDEGAKGFIHQFSSGIDREPLSGRDRTNNPQVLLTWWKKAVGCKKSDTFPRGHDPDTNSNLWMAPFEPVPKVRGLCPLHLRIFVFHIPDRMVVGNMHMRFVLGNSSFLTNCGSHQIVRAAATRDWKGSNVLLAWRRENNFPPTLLSSSV